MSCCSSGAPFCCVETKETLTLALCGVRQTGGVFVYKRAVTSAYSFLEFC